MSVKILLAVNMNKENYESAVAGCGAEFATTYLNEIEGEFDGLILCGGNDIDPKYYGEELNGAVDVDCERDVAEFKLAEKYIEAGKPVMGICRGHQLLNVYFGGTLQQHIDNVEKHRVEGPVEQIHLTRAIDGSICEKLYGSEFVVNSIHHQAVKKLGKGLKVTMTSVDDMIVEGFEHEELPVFGIQWHPERMCFNKRRMDTIDGAPIFRYFIELCEKIKMQKESVE